MALTRSAAATALWRVLARQSVTSLHVQTCHDCLASPSTCRITYLASHARTASHDVRYQSTSASAAPKQDEAAFAQSSYSSGEAGKASRSTSKNTASRSSSKESSNSNRKPQQTPKIASHERPTIADLETVRPRRGSIPRPHIAATSDSPDVALYNRRFKKLAKRVNSSFTREQLKHLGWLLRLDEEAYAPNANKSDTIRRILVDHWGLVDPADLAKRPKTGEKMSSSGPQQREEEIPITDKEVFFLLGKGSGSDLILSLSERGGARASVRGQAPSATLHLTGTPEEVKATRKEWEMIKSEIRTVAIDTGLGDSEPLRTDLYRSLSMATDTLVAPAAAGKKGSSKGKLEVTYRSKTSAPVERVQALLRRVTTQSAIQQAVPRFGLLDQDHEENDVLLPFVSQDSLPWSLKSLPIPSLARLASAEQTYHPKAFQSVGQPDSVSKIDDKLLDPLNDVIQGELQIKAGFGVLLRLESSPSKLVQPLNIDEWHSKPDDIFITGSPPGVANRFNLQLRRYEMWQLEQHTETLEVTNSTIRRLLYLPEKISMPVQFVELERPITLAAKDLPPATAEEEKDAEVAQPWTGRVGQGSIVDVAMPHTTIDARLEATKSSSLPAEILATFTEINRQSAPTHFELEGGVYHLHEDHLIRTTLFNTGLPEPWAHISNEHFDCVMERRSDFLDRGAKSVAFELRSKSSRANVQEILEVLERI